MSDLSPLSPAKRALLEQALGRRRQSWAAADLIGRRPPGEAVPLSSTQRRMWFLAQWAPNGFTFNAARAIRFRGRLDREALRHALTGVVARHESLRTIVAPGPEPHQRVLEDWTLPLSVLPLPGGGESGGAKLAGLLRELSRQPFDLTADLPIRATLIELGPDDHVLLLRIHHIAADAHSDGILFRELSELYRAHRAGRSADLAEIPVQYADYTRWQNARLTGPYLEELTAYWRRELDGVPPLLVLPTDRPRPAVQRNAGAHRRLTLDRSLAEGLIELSRGERATFYIATLAVFATLLYRRTGSDDFVIGSPIANRTRLELEPVIGFFSNTLALRLRLGGNPSFRELLARVRDTATGAYAHQDLPFEKVVEAVAPRRDPSYNPLFQVNFRAQVSERTGLTLEGLESEPVPVDIGFSRFDLALELELRERSLDGYFEYDEDLFEAETIDGMILDLTALLDQVVAAPDTPLLELHLPRRIKVKAPGAGIPRRQRS